MKTKKFKETLLETSKKRKIKIIITHVSPTYTRYGNKIISTEGHVIINNKKYSFYYDNENGLSGGVENAKLTNNEYHKLGNKISKFARSIKIKKTSIVKI